MEHIEKLEPGYLYHIYNKGINGTPIFTKPEHYQHFLKMYAYYLEPVVQTYAYCLLGNHFHFMIRVLEEKELDLNRWRTERGWQKQPDASRQWSHFFNAYAQAFNYDQKRTGSLFERRYHRKRITSDNYYTQLVYYIHANPARHGFCPDFRQYLYSSYQSHLSEKPTGLQRRAVLDWFGGKEAYIAYHNGMWLEEADTLKTIII